MKRKILSDEFINEIQEIHNSGIYWYKLPQKTGISKTVLNKYLSDGKIIKILHKRKHSNETKNKISKARKKYLKENPDKHPWKNNSKFKSNPCELFKEKLKKLNVIFSSEFTDPNWCRIYAIDIAFPCHKIGIEINGNQHYNNDGTLKDYYIKRNKYLTELGWYIYNIHYSIIYNDILSTNIINDIKQHSLSQTEYDKYVDYYNKNKKKYNCISCGNEITKYSKSNKCNKCSKKEKRKVDRPNKEELKELIEKYNWCEIGRKFSVSDNTIRKWAKNYNLI